MDFASLGLAVDSRSAVSAAGDLDRFTAASGRAESAAQKVGTTSSSAARGTDQLHRSLANIERLLHSINMRGYSANVISASQAMDKQAQAADRLATSLTKVGRARTASGGADNDNESRFRRQNLTYQLFDIGQTLPTMNPALIAMQQGPQILQLYAGQGGINAALKDTMGLLGGVARAAGPVGIAISVVAMGIAAARDRMEELSGKTISFGDIGNGVLGQITDGLTNRFGTAIDLVQGWFDKFWTWLGSAAYTEYNNLARGAAQFSEQIRLATTLATVYFEHGYRAAIAAWDGLPSAMGDLMVQGMNAAISAINTGISTMISKFNSMIQWVRGQAEDIAGWFGTKLPGQARTVDPNAFQISEIANPWAGQADNFDIKMAEIAKDRQASVRKAWEGYAAAIDKIFDTDYFSDLMKRAETARTERLKDNAGKVDPWLMGSTDLRQVDSEAVSRIRKQQNEAIQEAQKSWDQNKTAMRGFFGDLYSGFKGGGKTAAEVFMNAFANAMDNLANRALDSFANYLATALFGARPGGASGSIGQTLAQSAGGALATMPGVANDNLVGMGETAQMAARMMRGGRQEYGNDLPSNIKALAGNIGSTPLDVGTVMSFESRFNKDIWGGKGGQHYGLIQAGANERSQYGIKPGGSLASQFTGIESYLKDRGFKPGMSGMDLYSTINAGRPGRYGASDTANGGTWGSVADKWNHQMEQHREAAKKLLGATETSTQALETVAEGAGAATQGLSGLAGGLGQLGQSLMSIGGGAGGGGWFSSLMGKLGGLAGATNYMTGISPMATAAIARGGFGLFSTGGYTGDGDPSRLAGGVHKGEYVFDALSTARIGVENLAAMRQGRAANSNQPQRVVFSIDVKGAMGDADLDRRVRAGVQAGISQYDSMFEARLNEGMERVG